MLHKARSHIHAALLVHTDCGRGGESNARSLGPAPLGFAAENVHAVFVRGVCRLFFILPAAHREGKGEVTLSKREDNVAIASV